MHRAPLVLTVVLTLALALATAHVAEAKVDNAKRPCAYTAHSISKLQAFGRMVHRTFRCALVFNNANITWRSWERPWFTVHGDRNLNWAKWARARGKGRRLIITQNLIPDTAQAKGWRAKGANGRYKVHARRLARNLVRAKLGRSVIRLGHEANGTWFTDNIGQTEEDFARWVRFWRHTVRAMRSVRGAHFRFDWTINARYRNIPLLKFYPGDDVVDIVGIDAYDTGIPAGQPRWEKTYEAPLGIRELVEFAAAHGKPLSIPEWGVSPLGFQLSGGDNPEYVDGIARVVRTTPVSYQAYFSNHEWAFQLANGPLSLAAYRKHFGAGGDSAGKG